MKKSQVKIAIKQLRKLHSRRCSRCGQQFSYTATQQLYPKEDVWTITVHCKCQAMTFKGLQ